MDAEAIGELFSALRGVRVRAMFGGRGVFFGDLMFALESAGEIYLKAYAEILGRFEEAGSRPFAYTRNGRSMHLGYWRLPDAALDDPEEAGRWARLAADAARRSATVKSAKAPRRKRPPLKGRAVAPLSYLGKLAARAGVF